MKSSNKNSAATTKKSPDAVAKQVQVACDKIRPLMNDTNASDLRGKYAIGCEVNALKAKEKKYGKGLIGGVAEELGCTTVLLYGYGKVADRWSKEEFAALANRTNSKHVKLTFAHFRVLAALPTDTTEARLAETLQESLSARAMEQKFTQSNKKPQPREVEFDMVEVMKEADKLLARDVANPSPELAAALQKLVEHASNVRKAFDAKMDAAQQRLADVMRTLAGSASPRAVSSDEPTVTVPEQSAA